MTSVVRANLKYLADAGKPPIYHASVAGGEPSQYDGEFQIRAVTIGNARERLQDFDLDREGFALVGHDTAVSDFYRDSQIEDIYDREIESLVREYTGAARAYVFDHTRRADSQAMRVDKHVREPVPLIHNDYSDRSARQRVRDMLPAEAEGLLARRFAIINVWRSIEGPVLTMPLALCDAGTVDDDDLIPVERRARDRIGELQLAVFNDKHRWFYFPDMAETEALLFKTHDSATDGRARRSLHSAFKDPTTPASAPPRQTIESRVFAFF